MISIFTFGFISLYYYIGNYIFIIPFIFSYLNYVKNTKINIIENKINNEKNFIKLIGYKTLNQILKPNIKLNYYNIILNNKYNNNKIFLIFIKFDNIFLLITNEFLLYILFYMKLLFKFLLANQFNNSIHKKKEANNISIEEKKKIYYLLLIKNIIK